MSSLARSIVLRVMFNNFIEHLTFSSRCVYQKPVSAYPAISPSTQFISGAYFAVGIKTILFILSRASFTLLA